MNRIQRFAAFSAVSASLLAGPAFAQDHDDHRDDRNNQSYHDDRDHRDNRDQAYRNDDHHDAYVRHDEWKRGYHMRHEDWDRGVRVEDWRAHHLRQPPRGYEWRQIDGNYVLANINTGTISMSMAIR